MSANKNILNDSEIIVLNWLTWMEFRLHVTAKVFIEFETNHILSMFKDHLFGVTRTILSSKLSNTKLQILRQNKVR